MTFKQNIFPICSHYANITCEKCRYICVLFSDKLILWHEVLRQNALEMYYESNYKIPMSSKHVIEWIKSTNSSLRRQLDGIPTMVVQKYQNYRKLFMPTESIKQGNDEDISKILEGVDKLTDIVKNTKMKKKNRQALVALKYTFGVICEPMCELSTAIATAGISLGIGLAFSALASSLEAVIAKHELPTIILETLQRISKLASHLKDTLDELNKSQTGEKQIKEDLKKDFIGITEILIEGMDFIENIVKMNRDRNRFSQIANANRQIKELEDWNKNVSKALADKAAMKTITHGYYLRVIGAQVKVIDSKIIASSVILGAANIVIIWNIKQLKDIVVQGKWLNVINTIVQGVRQFVLRCTKELIKLSTKQIVSKFGHYVLGIIANGKSLTYNYDDCSLIE